MLTLMLAMIDAPEDKKLFREIYELHRSWMLKAAYGILKERGLFVWYSRSGCDLSRD